MTIDFPSKQDVLFRTNNFMSIAWLGNPLSNREVRYSSGYRLAGELLTNHALENPDNIDSLVYPIILSYRHGIELQLKAVLRDGQDLLAETPNVPCRHDLRLLWNMCKPIITRVWPEGDKSPLRAMDRLIIELSDVDPDGMAFRYAKDLAGGPTLSEIETVDLENFKEVIKKITHFLDCVSTGISGDLSDLKALQAEDAHW